MSWFCTWFWCVVTCVHTQVMLLGAHPQDTIDRDMRVTVAFNHFGANLIERMPRWMRCSCSWFGDRIPNYLRTLLTNLRSTWHSILFLCRCRCRQGTFHIVNNNYESWEMYAIGGSENPIINSEGNRFVAPDARFKKEVNFMLLWSIFQRPLLSTVLCEHSADLEMQISEIFIWNLSVFFLKHRLASSAGHEAHWRWRKQKRGQLELEIFGWPVSEWRILH